MSSTTTIQPFHGSYLMPSLEHATVADAMHPGILSCPADASLTDVARMMGTHHVHSVAVIGISRNKSGESLVWGIISDLDLVRAESARTPIGPRERSRCSLSSLSNRPWVCAKRES